MATTTAFLTNRGIPVCGHIGLTPQSVFQLGGYRVQGRADGDQERLLTDAMALEEAGASLLVLEAMPARVADFITSHLGIPTIGIGASAQCSGQVLVLHDMLDIAPDKSLVSSKFLWPAVILLSQRLWTMWMMFAPEHFRGRISNTRNN